MNEQKLRALEELRVPAKLSTNYPAKGKFGIKSRMISYGTTVCFVSFSTTWITLVTEPTNYLFIISLLLTITLAIKARLSRVLVQ